MNENGTAGANDEDDDEKRPNYSTEAGIEKILGLIAELTNPDTWHFSDRKVPVDEDGWGGEVHYMLDPGDGLCSALNLKSANVKRFLAEAPSAILDLQEALQALRTTTDVGRLQVQLAGCLTAAEGHDTSKARRAKRSDYGWSAAYEAVCNLRAKFDALERVSKGLINRLHEAFAEKYGKGFTDKLGNIINEMLEEESKREAPRHVPE